MKNKYYYYTNGTKSLDETVKQYLKKRKDDKSLEFVIIANKEFFINKQFKSNFESILEKLKTNNIEPHSVEFALNERNRRFSVDEWNLFKQFDAYFSKRGINFGFEDMENVWSVQEVETANNNIVKTADEIRKHNLSPYEKLLMAYMSVTSRKYIQESQDEHFSKSRSVYGILNSDRIVCVGYAELLKAITKELGDENIKVYTNRVACSKDGKVINGFHENLIVHIQDEKYGICGFYYLDPTWDCGHEYKELPKLAYFMTPLKDIDKIKHQIRGEWSGLPRAKTIKDDMAKSTGGSWRVYNRKNKSSVSFTSDGFKLSKNFLRDAIKMYPELENIVKNKNNDEVFSNWTPYYDRLQQNKQICLQILEVINEHNINYVTYENYQDFKTILEKSLMNNNLERFNAWIEKMKGKQVEDACETLIAKIKEEFKNNPEYCNYKYYIQEIKKLKEMLTRKGYEKFIDELVERCSQSFPDKSKMEIRALCENDLSYEQYIEGNAYQGQLLRQYQDIIRKFKNNLRYVEKKLREEYTKNPDFNKRVHCLGEKASIYGRFLFNENNSTKEIANEIIDDINIDKIYSVKDMINVKISEIDKEDLHVIDMLQSYEDLSTEKSIQKFVEGHKGMGISVDKWFKSKSAPIDINKTASALKKILLKTHKELSEQEIYDLSWEIVNSTCSCVKEKYEQTAVNSFMENEIQKQEAIQHKL